MLIFTGGGVLWISFATSIVSKLRVQFVMRKQKLGSWVMGVRTEVQTRDCLLLKFKLAVKQGFFPLRKP